MRGEQSVQNVTSPCHISSTVLWKQRRRSFQLFSRPLNVLAEPSEPGGWDAAPVQVMTLRKGICTAQICPHKKRPHKNYRQASPHVRSQFSDHRPCCDPDRVPKDRPLRLFMQQQQKGQLVYNIFRCY